MKNENKEETPETESLENLNYLPVALCVIGRPQLLPGIYPVKLISSKECLVTHSLHNRLRDEKRNFNFDISDCTIFTVYHLNHERAEFEKLAKDTNKDFPNLITEIIEESLEAISEFILWTKAQDLAGITTPFNRQVGRLDIKYCVMDMTDGRTIFYRNPLYWTNVDPSAIFSSMFGNMIVENGPAQFPIPAITRRIMGSLDLVNLGFYTEAFISMFALADDLLQEIIKKGLGKLGLAESEQEDLLRSIKEQRLSRYSTLLVKVCGWKSLEEENEKLYKKLKKTNELRNKIMHGSTRITREQTLNALDVLADFINWLGTNPFNYLIPEFPDFKLANLDFDVMNPVCGEKEENEN